MTLDHWVTLWTMLLLIVRSCVTYLLLKCRQVPGTNLGHQLLQTIKALVRCRRAQHQRRTQQLREVVEPERKNPPRSLQRRSWKRRYFSLCLMYGTDCWVISKVDQGVNNWWLLCMVFHIKWHQCVWYDELQKLTKQLRCHHITWLNVAYF